MSGHGLHHPVVDAVVVLKGVEVAAVADEREEERALREQMMEERFAQIERENRLLLEKMSYIMQRDTLDNKNSAMKYGRSLNDPAICLSSKSTCKLWGSELKFNEA